MSTRRTTIPTRPIPRLSMGTAFFYGCAAGAIGVLAMTFGEKIEQAITGRPNSYIPGATLCRLLGMDPYHPPNCTINMIMHCGQGILVGGARGVMAYYGVRGPFADFMLTGIRLLVDQTLENVTGVGALPWTWPIGEQVIDILHKAVFAFVTGYFADNWVQ
ncbi:hypothetical protein M422DRAFT_155106 [Sphaerobolus stellatus SS14]|nr:hypothetical protein M422DRAFT_155106 [Sphaerobolus stellatus SS14]